MTKQVSRRTDAATKLAPRYALCRDARYATRRTPISGVALEDRRPLTGILAALFAALGAAVRR